MRKWARVKSPRARNEELKRNSEYFKRVMRKLGRRCAKRRI